MLFYEILENKSNNRKQPGDCLGLCFRGIDFKKGFIF